VHGKGSLLAKMPGDPWQQRANLRLLLGYQWGSLGGKLLFMGGELGQPGEWRHTGSVDWHLRGDPGHAGLEEWVGALNRVYRSHPSLADTPGSAWWIACNDSAGSVFAWARMQPGADEVTIWAANFTPVPRPGYRVGVPFGGRWGLVLNGDDAAFGGSSHPVVTELEADAIPWDGQPCSLVLTLPPLALVVYARILPVT
jgi:1,4-alpha-glucan branching enzyme